MEIDALINIILIIPAVFYFIALLWINHGFRRQSAIRGPKITPSVSVVVSFHNEEKNVNQLADCFKRLDYPVHKREFILIDDRSTDRTNEHLQIAAKKIENCSVLKISDVQADFAPKKFAIDLAVRQAQGEIILLTDADGRPGEQWMNAITAEFSDDVGMVLGHAPYSAPNDKQILSFQLLKMEYFSHAAIAAATTGLEFPVTCVGTNLAYRKSVYLELNGFGLMRPIHTGDDDLFLQRVRDETGWKIRYAYDPDSFVPNAPPRSWKQFYHQRLRYASKGFIYPTGYKTTLILFYFFYLILLCVSLAAIFGFISPFAATGVILTKVISDFIFMKSASHVFKFPLPALWILLASVVHIPYVLYFGLMANLHRFEWGGLRKPDR